MDPLEIYRGANFITSLTSAGKKNRKKSSQILQTCSPTHIEQLFNWTELDWTIGVASPCAPCLGHVIPNLKRLWSCRYSFCRYVCKILEFSYRFNFLTSHILWLYRV